MTRTTHDGLYIRRSIERNIIYLCVCHDDFPGGLSYAYTEPHHETGTRKRLFREGRTALVQMRSEQAEREAHQSTPKYRMFTEDELRAYMSETVRSEHDDTDGSARYTDRWISDGYGSADDAIQTYRRHGRISD